MPASPGAEGLADVELYLNGSKFNLLPVSAVSPNSCLIPAALILFQLPKHVQSCHDLSRAIFTPRSVSTTPFASFVLLHLSTSCVTRPHATIILLYLLPSCITHLPASHLLLHYSSSCTTHPPAFGLNKVPHTQKPQHLLNVKKPHATARCTGLPETCSTCDFSKDCWTFQNLTSFLLPQVNDDPFSVPNSI